MIRYSLLLFHCIGLFAVASAQQPIVAENAEAVLMHQAVEEEACSDPWARFHGFIFRRYAGSVEMESKTPYPKNYFGRFTFLPWKPDWVRTPANALRRSQYRHHQRGTGTTNLLHGIPAGTVVSPPLMMQPLSQPAPMESKPMGTLEDVQLEELGPIPN
ncbi:MAG: hypothetical protein AAF802_09740 [Planctomycetota bacterium]